MTAQRPQPSHYGSATPHETTRANSQSGGGTIFSALIWAGVIVLRQQSVDLLLCANRLLVEAKTLVLRPQPFR